MDVLGKTIGSYRVVELIGEGGMGHVYRAVHQRLGRHVALKVLKPELAHRADVARRFLEEARAVNDIGHPQIVDIYDFMEDYEREPPLVCMVMELLKGQSLARWIARRGALAPSDTIHIARQVTEILEAVHGAMILHRDLKAENIFLLDGEGPRQVKLLDFGSIKSLDEEQQLHLTDPGTALGTPEYMAPEQVLGEKLDERTDIYAMGVVLYKMLSGNVPFSSPSYGALMVDVLKSRPPTISRDQTHDSTPIPRPLQSIVMRCLQKKPVRRYSSMAQLRQALDESAAALLATSSPSALLAARADRCPDSEPPEHSESGESVPRKKASLRMAAVLAAISLIAGLAIWLASAQNGPEPRTPARTTTTASARDRNLPAALPSSESTGAAAAPATAGTLAAKDPVAPLNASPATARVTPASRGGAKADAQGRKTNEAPSKKRPQAARARRGLPRRRAERRHSGAGSTGTSGTGEQASHPRTRSRRPASAESTTVDPFSM